MRILVLGVFLVVAACTKPNPNVCCVTPLQCDALGVDEPRPCDVGQACRAGGCVAAECQAAADCSADSPICSNNLCVGTCQIDDDCAEVAGRNRCSAQGTCVGCLDASQCPASASICDGAEHTCRGCAQDTECATGVCIETDGVCAAETDLLFVQATGATDTGSCPRSAPCATIRYAIQRASATRNVIRVTGGSLPERTVLVDKPIVIDATGTSIGQPGVAAFDLLATLSATIGGMTIRDNGSTTVSVINVPASDTLKLGPGTSLSGPLAFMNATVLVNQAEMSGAEIVCTSGTLDIARSHLLNGHIGGSACHLTLTRSTIEGDSDRLVQVTGGDVRIENNLFVQRYEYADSLSFQGCAPGSTFRFNTVVNVSGVNADGQALFCDATVDVTSNIFAYASGHPMGFPNGAYCLAKYSLFDDVSIPLHAAGEGNKTAAPTSFFVNRVGKDFHLAPGSPAIDTAQQVLPVSMDLEGKPRPMGHLDMGAFESQ